MAENRTFVITYMDGVERVTEYLHDSSRWIKREEFLLDLGYSVESWIQ